MSRVKGGAILRRFILLCISFEIARRLNLFIVGQSGMMPYWMDVTIRHVLIAFGHDAVIDPWDITDISVFATFFLCWIAVGAVMYLAWRLITGHRLHKKDPSNGRS